MDIIRKIRKGMLTADTLADPNVPNYIKAGFKTEFAFLKWLVPKTPNENNIEEYRKWDYPSRGAVVGAYVDAVLKDAGLPIPTEEDEEDEEDEETCFVVYR